MVRRVDARLDHQHHEVVAHRVRSGARPGPKGPGLLLLLLALTSCRAPTAAQLSYLAILPTILAPEASVAGTHYRYRVHELSGKLPLDTLVVVAPTDTVILPVRPATYVVELDGVPAQCRIRDGGERVVLIGEGTNTTAVRYFVLCQSQLVISVFTDGATANLAFVYHVAAANGAQHVGLLHPTDTLELEGLVPGATTIDLASVPPQCAVTSDGGPQRVVQLDSAGGVEVDFRVRCADPAHRPHVQSLRASYHDGVAGFVFKAADPDRDIERYVWDLTDCRRTSLLPTGASTRGGLSSGRTANHDTITVLATFDVGKADSLMRGRCAALWIMDTQGNPSEVIEVPLGGVGRAPSANFFNAHFQGTELLRTELVAGDPDGDFVGVFVQVLLRDGTTGLPDGEPDVAYFNTVGYLGSAIPDVPLGSGRLTYDAFYAVIVYLLDAQGNFTRLVDNDLFR